MFDKKVLKTLILSLIVAVIIALVTDNKMDDEYYKALFVHKVFTEQKYDIIIAGDSRIYRGISAKITGDKLKLKALNLGFSSGGHSKPLFDLTEKHLDKKSPEKIIILGITPASLTPRASANGHIARVLKRKKEEVLEYKYLFTVKLFFAPTTPYKIRKKIKRKHSNDYRQEFHTKEGWIASWYDKPIPYRALKSYAEKFSKEKVNPEIINTLINQVRKWTNEGIKVYGFFVPSSPNMNELEKNKSGFDYENFVKDFIDAGAYWINIEGKYFSYDGSHLEKESAVKLSTEIADKILKDDVIKKYSPSLKINDIYNVDDYEYKITKDSLLISGEYDTIYFSKSDKLLKNEIKQVRIVTEIFYGDTTDNLILGCKTSGKRTEINAVWSSVPGKLCKLYLDFKLPETVSEKDTLYIYVENPQKKEIIFKNTEIYFCKTE